MWTVLAQDQGPLSSFSSARSTTREPIHSVHVAKEASSCCISCVCIELVWLVQLWLLDYAGSGVQWTGDLVNSSIPDQVWHAILLSIFPRLSQFSLFIFSWSNVCMVCCRNVVTSHRAVIEECFDINAGANRVCDNSTECPNFPPNGMLIFINIHAHGDQRININ